MKKLLFFMLTAVVLTAVAQQPAWYDAARRSADYPAGQYFTGFAEGQRLGSERQEAALKRLQDAARTEAANSIRVHVQNTTTNTGLSRTLKTMEGTFRSSTRELATSTTTSVDMQIPGLQDFFSLFEGKESHAHIKWTGSNLQLSYLIRVMTERNYISTPDGAGKWTCVYNHFTDKNNRQLPKLNSLHTPIKSKAAIEQLAELLNPNDC